jgi:cephalosporin-C deacetylase-like acetyl esterase
LPNNLWLYSNTFKGKADFDTDALIRQVIDLRRALDVLSAQPGVDANRLAVVGHDFGGMYSALLSAVDSRPKGFVLMALTTDFLDWPQPSNVSDPEYRKVLAAFAPIKYVPHALAPIFFQFGSADEYVSDKEAQALYDAAHEPKKMMMYDKIGHNLKSDQVAQDRMNWLLDILDIK